VRRITTALTVFLLLPCFADAQQVDVAIPANILLPNYERVPLGQRQALEGGAYLVRADDAMAPWYNPAGLAQSPRTQVSAGSNAYEGVSLELAGRAQKTGSLRFAPLGSYFGVVIAEPVISSDRYRLGFSIANPLAWEPGSIQFTPELRPGINLALVDDASLSRFEPALSVGYRATDRVRLGVGLGLSITSLKQHQDIMVRASGPNAGRTLRRTFITDGSTYHGLAHAGVQWDVTDAFSVGGTLQSSGWRISGSSHLLYAFGDYTANGFDDAAFAEDEAKFDYRLPIVLGAGAAYRFGRGALEVDVRYYGAEDPHAIFETDTAGRRVVADSAGTTTTSLPFRPTPNEWREVVNVAVGGNYQLSRRFRLHAGYNTDRSPVADPSTSIFRRVNLSGFSTGVSFETSQFTGALGTALSTGESEGVGSFTDDQGNPVESSIKVRSVRIFYAISFTFDG
jgi:long-subunit fatty acid transport protein